MINQVMHTTLFTHAITHDLCHTTAQVSQRSWFRIPFRLEFNFTTVVSASERNLAKVGLDSLYEKGYKDPLCRVCGLNFCKKCKFASNVLQRCELRDSFLSSPCSAINYHGDVGVYGQKTRTTRVFLIDMVLSILKIIIGFYQVTCGLLEAFS